MHPLAIGTVPKSSGAGERGRDPYLLIWRLFVDDIGPARCQEGHDPGLPSDSHSILIILFFDVCKGEMVVGKGYVSVDKVAMIFETG